MDRWLPANQKWRLSPPVGPGCVLGCSWTHWVPVLVTMLTRAGLHARLAELVQGWTQEGLCLPRDPASVGTTQKCAF